MPASSYSRSPALRIRVAPEEVAFWHWPLRDRGPGAWLALAIVFGLTALAYALSGSRPMTGLTLVSLLLASWRNWLPVWFEIGPAGITQQVLWLRRRWAWTAIQHHQIGLYGVLLLPDAVVTRLSPLRGLYLHWGRHRGPVLANIEYYLQSWTADQAVGGRDSTQLMQRPPA